MTDILRPGIAAQAPDEEATILRWLRDQQWLVTNSKGEIGSLAALPLQRLQADATMKNNGIIKCILRCYMEDTLANTQATAKTAPGPKTPPSSESEGKHEYDDGTLTRIVLEFLMSNRLKDYTYNQIADDPLIRGDWKAVSRVLRRLVKCGTDIVQYDIKKPRGGKAELFKYAPERKALDRNYVRVHELVGGAILGHLGTHGASSQNAICGAMRSYFGYIDKAVVKQVLETLRVQEMVYENVGPRNAKVFSLPVADQNLR